MYLNSSMVGAMCP